MTRSDAPYDDDACESHAYAKAHRELPRHGNLPDFISVKPTQKPIKSNVEIEPERASN